MHLSAADGCNPADLCKHAPTLTVTAGNPFRLVRSAHGAQVSAVLHDDWPKAHWEIACADLGVLRDAADWPEGQVTGLALCLVRVPLWQAFRSDVRSRMAACLELAANGR